MPQVDYKHYLKPDYLTPERLASLSYQFSEIVTCNPKSILEIGIGQGLLTHLLRTAGFSVTTFDFDPMLSPDVVGNIKDIRLPDSSFDLVVCFQVLEHLPFEDFKVTLKEINRVTSQWALISLPHAGYYFQFGFQLPILGQHFKLFSLPFHLRKHQFMGEHYWEIGKKNYPFSRIIKSFEQTPFRILKSYRMPRHPYHMMFVLEKLKVSM